MRNARTTIALLLCTVALAVSPAGAADDETTLRAELTELVRNGDDDALLRAADAALAASPTSVPALEHRAFALQRLGRLREAREAYEGLVEASPEHVWGLTRLGAMHASERRFDEAVAYLRRAVAAGPTASAARVALVDSLRGAGDMTAARREADLAKRADPAAGWAWRAEAELAWMRGDIDDAWTALEGARRLGADELARLTEVITLDRRLLEASDDPGALRAAWRDGAEWSFAVGTARVRTSVATRLPGDLVQMVRELPARFARVVGDDRKHDRDIVLRISRTLDEHERIRRVMYPQGSPGRAFTVTGGMGRGARSGARDVTVYVAWTSDDVKTSLAHELAHAALRGAASDVPVWLDEGVATYLETLRHGDDAVTLDRPDLDGLLRAGVADGRTFAWPRMMAAQRADFEGADGRLRYAQAWSMVRFLLQSPAVGSDPETRRNRFVRALRTGDRLRGRRSRGPGRGGWADWKASLEEIYEMPLESLEDAWRATVE